MQAFFRYTFVLGCLDIPKYKEDVQNFVLSGTKLLNIYAEDKKQRQIMEGKYMLRMREWENNFYEDQKDTRKQWCSGKEEKRSTRTDERFKKRYPAETETGKKEVRHFKHIVYIFKLLTIFCLICFIQTDS